VHGLEGSEGSVAFADSREPALAGITTGHDDGLDVCATLDDVVVLPALGGEATEFEVEVEEFTHEGEG